NLSIYRDLLSKGMPVVFFNSYYKELFEKPYDNCGFVSMDDENASYELTSSLISLGHSKIGAVMKFDELCGHNRYAGYLRALTEYEVPVTDSSVVWFGNRNTDDVVSVLDKYDIFTKFTAIVCYNDRTAMQLIDELKKRETTITAVGSFDGIPNIVPEDLQFISKEMPSKQIGSIATENLINIINGRKADCILLPVK
ncbi:MAG: substrate-binding domain-containing protein, partial [Oscillospiraceae bacterium]|nr:substrate-binding domain-containing protein [Oscillospiraceae bacterium]